VRKDDFLHSPALETANFAFLRRRTKITKFFNVTNTLHFSMSDMVVQDQGLGSSTSLFLSSPAREMKNGSMKVQVV
jgi:hypothetical protein